MMRRYISFPVLMEAVFCFLVIGFLAVPTASGAPASSFNSALRRYPYITDTARTYATINWATNRSQSTGSVSYGKVGSEACTAHSVTATKTAISVNGVAEYQWKAQLTLNTGTQYCYRVYLGTIDLLGSDPAPAFRTQLSSTATQSFSFAVIGDWGLVDSSGTNPSQAKLMSLIASSGVRFVVTVGDNGYPAGNQANYGDLVQTGSNVSAVFGPSFWKVPGASRSLFMTQGNHGIASPDTNHPALINWPEDRTISTSGGRYQKDTYCCLDGTTSASYPSVWYAFNAGPARFYVLQAAWSEANVGNSNIYKVDYDYHWAPSTAQYKWLQNDLAAHPSGLKFAFFHYPLYSDNPTESSDTFLQGSNKLEGLLKQNGVSIAFTGHAHIYQRNRASAAGVINYVTGGGGAILEPLGACSSLDAYAIGFTTTGSACGSAPVPTSAGQVYHFLKVTVNGTQVTVTPINSLGQSFDVMNYTFATNVAAIAPETIVPVAPTNPTSTPTSSPNPANLPAVTERATFTSIPATPSPVTSTPTTTATSTCTPTPTTSPAATDSVTLTPTSTNLPLATGTPTPTATSTCTSTPTPSPTATATPSPTETLTPTAVPAVTTGPGSALTFIAEADAHVAEVSPDANFGALPILQSNGSSGNVQTSYIRFTVKGTHDTIQDVKLRVFCTDGAANGPAVYLADNNWIESGIGGITWNHQPDLWSSEIDNKGEIGAGTWVEYDVASLVTGDGNYSFALVADSPNDSTFSSREGLMPPQLVVTFAP